MRDGWISYLRRAWAACGVGLDIREVEFHGPCPDSDRWRILYRGEPYTVSERLYNRLRNMQQFG